MSALLLPMELQLHTLHNLPFRDVLNCRLLSKHFRALVDSNKELAYTIELGAAGVRDISGSSPRREAKVEKLWQLNVAWANLHWLCRRQIPLSETTKLFDASGGFFFYAKESRDNNLRNAAVVEWFKLPSRRDPNPVSAAADRIVFDVAIVDFAVDANRDLVFGLEIEKHRSGPFYTVYCNLYAKSMSLNQVHPEASGTILSYRFVSPTKDFKPSIEICGNHVGVLLTRDAQATHRDAFDMFLLIDWTTGIFKATMSSQATYEFWETFCFVAPDSVLIPSAHNGVLNIFHFDHQPGSLRHDVSLLLPETISCDGLRHIGVRSQPFHTQATPVPQAAADICTFVPDPLEAVVVLSLDYRYHANGLLAASSGDYNLPQVVAIPRRALARYASLARSESPDAVMQIKGLNEEPSVSVFMEVEMKTPGWGFDTECRCNKAHTKLQGDPINKRYPYLRAEQWIHETRWGLDSVTPSIGIFAYGSRFLAMSSRAVLPNAPGSAISLYDFNLRNERRGYEDSLDEENIRPYPAPDELFNEDEDWDYDEFTGNRRWPVNESQIVTKPTTVSIPEVFRKPFTTYLPYRVTETEMILPWDTAMLDGERIVGLDFENFANGTLRELDVIII